ncbi:hypothetical protein K445DRAFT_22630 [Daldinia sp. EC12]|nr:hypothetical protein K445DRAFT_22630 [Daldinia sp. EC12]
MPAEGNPLQQIDPVTLEPTELFTYSASDSSNEGMLAGRPTYKIFGVGPTGELNVLAVITDAPAAYIDTLFRTENYLILIVWQADFKQQGKDLLSTLGPWDPDRKTWIS